VYKLIVLLKGSEDGEKKLQMILEITSSKKLTAGEKLERRDSSCCSRPRRRQPFDEVRGQEGSESNFPVDGGPRSLGKSYVAISAAVEDKFNWPCRPFSGGGARPPLSP